MAGKEVELEALWKSADKKDRVSHETLIVQKIMPMKINEAGTNEKKSPWVTHQPFQKLGAERIWQENKKSFSLWKWKVFIKFQIYMPCSVNTPTLISPAEYDVFSSGFWEETGVGKVNSFSNNNEIYG